MQVKGAQVGGGSGKSSSKPYTSADSARAKAKARGSATGGSSYDAEAARQAELERQRKIKEYQELMRKIAEARAKLSRANNQLKEAKDILKTAYTGNKAAEYLSAITAVQAEVSSTDKYFKGISDAAAEKIKGLGGTSTNGTETNNTKTGENAQTTPKTFSCDTEALRDILPLLDSAYKDLQDAKTVAGNLPALEGCTDARKTSTKVGETMNKMKPLAQKLLKDIEAAERAERENRSLLDKMFGGIGDFFGNLFKPESKPNTNTDTNTNTDNSPFTSFPLFWQDDSLWKNFGTPKVPFGQTTDKDILYMVANKNGVDTEGKTDQKVLEETTTKVLADEYGIDTKDKTQDEILKEIADKIGIDTTTTVEQTVEDWSWGEFPLINQLDYPNVSFGNSNIRKSGCMIASYCMLLSGALGRTVTPEEFMKEHKDFGRYKVPGGGSDSMLQNEALLEESNLELVGNYYYGAAWDEGKLMEALEDGCVAIWRTKDENFTKGGHYEFITGLTEDGNIIIQDPNGENYDSKNPVLVEGFANGFDPKKIAQGGGNFYVYKLKNPREKTETQIKDKDDKTLLNEIVAESAGTVGGDLIKKLDDTVTNSTTFKEPITLGRPTTPKKSLNKDNSNQTNNDTETNKPEKTQTTIQPKNNSDIAHRGYHPGGIYENSAEAYIKAGEQGFWGCEADIIFDTEGNLVCSHNAVKPGQKTTSFEEYLDICKEYGMTAIIDLKYVGGFGDYKDLSPAVLKTIEEKGMLDSCILQTNNDKDIPYIRENSENARIWYLKDAISDADVKLIKDNNVEAVNIQNNSDYNNYRINKLTEMGVDVCVWNVNGEKGRENVLNGGSTYVMSDIAFSATTPYQEGEEDFNNVKNKNHSQEQVELKDINTNGTRDPYKKEEDRFNEDYNKKDNTNSSGLFWQDEDLKDLFGNGNNNSPTDVNDNSNTSDNKNANTNNSSGPKLTAPMGFNKDGPSGYETWYDLPMSQVVKNMEELYNWTDVSSTIREDGVKLISGTSPDGTRYENYVMVAADVRHEAANPQGTFERGQVVETSLGAGIVVDQCGLATEKRKNNQGVHFDIATAWWTEPYMSQAYSKKTETTPTDVNDTNAATNEPAQNANTNSSNTGSGNGANKDPLGSLFNKHYGEYDKIVAANKTEPEQVELKDINTDGTRDPYKKEEDRFNEDYNKKNNNQTLSDANTNNNEEKYPEIPNWDQNGMKDIKYGNTGNLADDGCGIVSSASILTYLFDTEISPELLANRYGGKYGGSWGTDPKIIKELIPEDFGVKIDVCYKDGWYSGKIEEALKNGQPVQMLVGADSPFTDGGHYITLTGMTDDGKVLVNDSNGKNYEKGGVLKDGFENGFSIETFKNLSTQAYFIYPKKGETEETELVKNIKKNNNDSTNVNTNNSNTSDNKQETSNKTNYESTLRSGVSYGPQAYETYYYDTEDPKDLSGVVSYLETYEGFKDLVHYTREDGVFMLSGTKPNGEKFEDLVMVAADVKHPDNPNGTFERGQIVETSVGTGIIADACGEAIRKRENNEGVQFDIGTIWYYKPEGPYDRNEIRGKVTSEPTDVNDTNTETTKTETNKPA